MVTKSNHPLTIYGCISFALQSSVNFKAGSAHLGPVYWFLVLDDEPLARMKHHRCVFRGLKCLTIPGGGLIKECL